MTQTKKTTTFIKERTTNDFLVVNKTFINDEKLSWQSKGVFIYLLSLPEDTPVSLKDLEQKATNGIDALRTAIKELQQKGYLTKYQTKINGKFSSCLYKINEVPKLDEPNEVVLEKQEETKKTSPESFERSFYNAVYDKYTENYKRVFGREPVINFNVCSKRLKKAFATYGPDKILAAIDNSMSDNWIMNNGYLLNVILAENCLPKYINGVKSCNKQAFDASMTDYTTSF